MAAAQSSHGATPRLSNGNNDLNLQESADPYLSLVEVGNGNNTITSSIPGLTIDLGTACAPTLL